MIKKIKNKLFGKKGSLSKDKRIAVYINNGQEPWSVGYLDYRNQIILETLQNSEFVNQFNSEDTVLPVGFGLKLDERLVEYCWIFSQIDTSKEDFLDAGSTFNYDYIINHDILANKKISILTFNPEENCFFRKRISYVYDDLRRTPFRDELFDTIVSQSTIEHIDMDNSIYGYDIDKHKDVEKKSYDYMKVIEEMYRMLKPRGKLLLTFPYGKFENHGFFQQFDDEMLGRIEIYLKGKGHLTTVYYRYTIEGWIVCTREDCKDVVSFNPHTGRGKGDDGAAHCRSICCIRFDKL